MLQRALRTISCRLILLAVLGQILFVIGAWCSFAEYDPFRSRHSTPPAHSAHNDDLKLAIAAQSHGLSLRHVFHHGAGQPGPRARRLDINTERISAKTDAAAYFSPFPLKTAPVKIDKPAIRSIDFQVPMSPLWLSEDVLGPDVKDKQTILTLANMSEDAYHPHPNDPDWLDIGEEYNSTLPFGWEDHGIRGHVFSDDSNSTVILSIKGTSIAMFEGNGTSVQDKENDNLFGSCCCGQGGQYLWRQVCDCQTGTYTCDQKCVSEELLKPNHYFEATLELYSEVVQLYPKASISTTGHSLGGVLASLLALRYGLPAITFEAYPQALAAARLGLPVAGAATPLRRNTGTFHFGHTADPVYMGTCNGASSFCTLAGYAFETLCHTGKRCVYDVVKDWGWRQSTNYHRLRFSIDNVYAKYEHAAPCEDEDVDCVDCYLWKFENGTRTTSRPSTPVTSTATSRTRTETCKTPGWWGCRDPTTTTTTEQPTSTSSATSSSSTSTCKTPGWFGCKDKTTTETGTTTSSEATTTTTCTTKGWFGRCLDPTTTTTTTAATTTPAEAAYKYWRSAPTATATPTHT